MPSTPAAFGLVPAPHCKGLRSSTWQLGSSTSPLRARRGQQAGTDRLRQCLCCATRAAYDEPSGKQDSAAYLGVRQSALFVILDGAMYNIATSLATFRRRERSCRKWASAS